jgi:DNA-binding transcriptional MerR regulator
VREDNKRQDLLFAGTEAGMFVSWNGGQNWQPLQLNLPVTPALDLMIRHDDIIVATSGRSIWILDDLGLLRQANEREEPFHLFEPEPAFISNHGSPLNRTSETFDGTNPLQGVNPANGIVVYYSLPELSEQDQVILEIFDSAGALVNAFTSEKDSSFQRYAGGPPSPPVLPKKAGLNRFVWDMRYPTLPGVPKAYIEASYRGHKAVPGEYSLKLKITHKQGESSKDEMDKSPEGGSAAETKVAATTSPNNAVPMETLEVAAKILPNPLYSTTPEQYAECHKHMSETEETLSQMHGKTNRLYKMQKQLTALLKSLSGDNPELEPLKQAGKDLLDSLKAWDEEMVQRKSKAYDDVENYPNKFTAEYLFMMNQSESSLPRVTQAAKDRRAELDDQWKTLEEQADDLLENQIPAFNERLWKSKIGAIWVGNEE